MIPRTRAIAVPARWFATSCREDRGRAPDPAPVYRGDLDDVIGMLHVNDLLRSSRRQEVDAPRSRAKRHGGLRPSAPRSAGRDAAGARGEAIVIDEYRGTAIWSVRALMERIVGESRVKRAPRPEIVVRPDGSADIDGLAAGAT